MTIFERKSRVIDVSDDKWAHPEARFTWLPPLEGDPYGFYDDESLTFEQKVEMAQKAIALAAGSQENSGYCDIVTYEVLGCPEEPGTSTKAVVYTPRNLNASKARTLFNIPGGGMYQCVPNDAQSIGFAERVGCIVVAPVYRTSLLGKYPAAVNDCHAVYKWMVDNAHMLHVDADNITLFGSSSGGHLACSLPFRLMRYGYSPRGVVARTPAVDDRGFTTSTRLHVGMSDGVDVHTSHRRWLGDKVALSTLEPEAYANRATVDDCIGYPPLFMHTSEFDIDRDNSTMFASKVLEAQSFAEMHLWGGLSHIIVNISGEPCPVIDRIESTVDANIETCFKYDLRRPWVYEKA